MVWVLESLLDSLCVPSVECIPCYDHGQNQYFQKTASAAAGRPLVRGVESVLLKLTCQERRYRHKAK